MKTIGIDQSSFTRSSFEHRCMKNINYIYQHAGKCDDQQNLKDIIEAAILSTPEIFIDNSPNVLWIEVLSLFSSWDDIIVCDKLVVYNVWFAEDDNTGFLSVGVGIFDQLYL